MFRGYVNGTCYYSYKAFKIAKAEYEEKLKTFQCK